jgi:hypothetical protein
MVKRKSRRNSKNYRKTKRVSRKMRSNKRINRKSNKRIKRRTNKRTKRRTNQRINGRSNKRMKRRTNQRMKRRRMGERTTYYKVGGGDVLEGDVLEGEGLSPMQQEFRSKIGESPLLEFLKKEIAETIGYFSFTDDEGGVHYDALEDESTKLIDVDGERRKIYGISVYDVCKAELLIEDKELFNIADSGENVISLNDDQFMKFAKFYSDFILKLQDLVNKFTQNQTAQHDRFWKMSRKAMLPARVGDHVKWDSDNFTILEHDLKEKPRPVGGVVYLKKNMKGIVTRIIQTDDDYDVQVVFKDIQPYIKNPFGVVCGTHDILVIDNDPALGEISESILAAANESLEAEEKRQKGLTLAQEGPAGMEGISPKPPSLPPSTGKVKTRRRTITAQLKEARAEQVAKAAAAGEDAQAEAQAAKAAAAKAAAAGEDVQAAAAASGYDYGEFNKKPPFEQQEEINRKEKELQDTRDLFKKNKRNIKQTGETDELSTEQTKLTHKKGELKGVIAMLKNTAPTTLTDDKWTSQSREAIQFLKTFDVFKIQEMQSIVNMCFALTRYGRVEDEVTHKHKLHTRDIEQAQNEVNEILSAVKRMGVEMSQRDLTDFQKWKFLVDLERCRRNEYAFRDNTCRKCNMKNTSKNMRIGGYDKPVFKCQDVRCPVFWVIDFNAAGVSQYNKQNACELHTLHMNGVEKTRGGNIPNSYFSVETFKDWVDTKKEIERFPDKQEGIPKWNYYLNSESVCLDFHKNHMIRLFDFESSSDGDVDLFILLQAAYNKMINILESSRKGGIADEDGGWEQAYGHVKFRAAYVLGMKVSEIMGSGKDETLNDRLLREHKRSQGSKYVLTTPTLPSLFSNIMLNVFKHEPSSLWDNDSGLINTKGTSAEIRFTLNGDNIVVHSFTRPL